MCNKLCDWFELFRCGQRNSSTFEIGRDSHKKRNKGRSVWINSDSWCLELFPAGRRSTHAAHRVGERAKENIPYTSDLPEAVAQLNYSRVGRFSVPQQFRVVLLCSEAGAHDGPRVPTIIEYKFTLDRAKGGPQCGGAISASAPQIKLGRSRWTNWHPN